MARPFWVGIRTDDRYPVPMDTLILQFETPAPPTGEAARSAISVPPISANDLGTAFTDVARAYPDRTAF